MQRFVIPCEPSGLYLFCHWQTARRSSAAYRAGMTDIEAERQSKEDTWFLVCEQLGSCSMQLFTFAKAVFQRNIMLSGFSFFKDIKQNLFLLYIDLQPGISLVFTDMSSLLRSPIQ